MIHKPVLLEETISSLNLKSGMTVIDGTLGAGGHSEAILKQIIPGGKLISIDWDKRAILNFEKKLSEGIPVAKKELIRPVRPALANIKNIHDDESSFHFQKLGNRGGEIVGDWCGVAGNFASLEEISREMGLKSANAILIDLGFSSDQIDNSERGFSFSKNGPLDMRYSPETQKVTAADIVNNYTVNELTRIFRNFGEEQFASSIAREIGKARKNGKIKKTEELTEAISRAVPEKYKHGRIHFSTKVFQALRIETNQELENLKIFLNRAIQILASKGILAIISFHSLEDRIVKYFFGVLAKGCVCPPNFPNCVCDHHSMIEILTRKPILASAEEIAKNPRARSAKLRVARRI